MKRAIVLSGGGAKGAYQIGVWKALRRLRIKYDIVTGSSVGSLNGALMTQNTFYRGLWLWRNITFNHVFSDEIKGDFNTKDGKKKIIKDVAKAVLTKSGLDVTELENNIKKVLRENKLRESKIDFGMVTFNLSTLKPTMLTKEEIPFGRLKDYLIASATCFPVFKKKSIDKDTYIDGGYCDNLPINLAISMGADEIIAVDLKAIGIKKPVKDKNVKVTYIKPRNNIGSFIGFNADLARRAIKLGFNDAMKTFDRLDGNKYTFKRYHLSRNYRRYGRYYNEVLNNILKKKNNVLAQIIKNIIYKDTLDEKDFTKVIEHLGILFKIDDSNIYSIKHFNRLLLDRLNEMEPVDIKFIEDTIKKQSLKKLVDGKYIIKYLYDKMSSKGKTKNIKELSSVALLLPHELLDAIYLYTITK